MNTLPCYLCALLASTTLATTVLAAAQSQRRGSPPRMTRVTLPEGRVEITIVGDQRVIRSNGIPDHAPGVFPRTGNPNALRPQTHVFRMPATPSANPEPTRMRGLFGVALNGVPFDPGTAEWWSPRHERPVHDRRSGWNYDALSGHIDLGVDEHHAHVQPTGTYHYHGLPTGLIAETEGMTQIGYAADGFPIYAARGHRDALDSTSPAVTLTSSYRLKTGARPAGDDGPGGVYDGTFVQDWTYVAGAGDLDECNGRFGVTPEHPEGTYHYVVTDTFPFVPRLFRGTPDRSFRHGPPPGRSRPRRR